MLSRRELITTGVAGSLAASPSAAPLATEVQDADRAGQREIARAVSSVEQVLRDSFSSPSLSYGIIELLRKEMSTFFRANFRFPEFIDIGLGVFMDVYDWHVKNRQQLVVTRGIDGRYNMQFMFTTLVLRGEQDPKFIGIPYDKV
jgi:hypothetical protein